uniref:BPL/LPL catalytic domain-containing protein n=1 Tax=Angiostrongylus cantonensis TaxID=6313 RepID=A0A0K0D046_ANGCA
MRYDVIGLGETRRQRPFDAINDSGEELFLGTCDSTGVVGVGVLVNTSLSIDSFVQLTTRTGCLRLKRCASISASTFFDVCAPASNYDKKEAEKFYMDVEKFYRKTIHPLRPSLEILNPQIRMERAM